MWLTRDLASIKNGETGASIIGDDVYIHKFYIKTNKLGSWDEDDKYMDQQIIEAGFDGLLLDDDIKLYNPKNARKIDDDFAIEKTVKNKKKMIK